MKPIKLYIIESTPLLLRGITHFFGSNYRYEVIGARNDTKEIIEIMGKIHLDILWLDTNLEDIRDCSLIKKVFNLYPSIKILLFGENDGYQKISQYLKNGSHAYLLKTANESEIHSALNQLEKNNIFIQNLYYSKINGGVIHGKISSCKTRGKLTKREREIIKLIVEEYTTREIAQMLFISQGTVETHRNNIIQKLGVKNVAGLVREALMNHLDIE